MTVALNPTISQLAPLLAALSSQLSLSAPLMKAPLDLPINQSVPIKILENNTGHGTTRVLNAVVLSSTLLSPVPSTQEQYKILLSEGKRQIEIINNAHLPIGTQLALKITENSNAAILLKILDGKPPAPIQTGERAAEHNTAIKTNSTTTNEKISTSLNKKPVASNTASIKTPLSSQQIIDQGVRQSLPQHQPTHQLVALLQQILKQNPEQLPKQFTQRINHLLQQFPTPEKMQQAQPAKQAIENSGIFLESKLARQAMAEQFTTNIIAKPEKNVEVQRDIKALLQSFSQHLTKKTQITLKPQQPIAPDRENPIHKLDEDFSAIQHKPLNAKKNDINNTEKKEQNLDIILRQLSRQLLSSIARTQLNQLESLNARQSRNIDNQTPINSWVTEIPIVNGEQIDNLRLRIEQETLEQSKDNNEEKQILWTVMLAFDLHALGKMNVQLKILKGTVSAIVWSAQEKTHAQVKQHIKELSNNLKKVGVSVSKIECQQGLPPNNASPLLQQLVDVRT